MKLMAGGVQCRVSAVTLMSDYCLKPADNLCKLDEYEAKSGVRYCGLIGIDPAGMSSSRSDFS